MTNKSYFSGAKRARLIMMFFALLAALAALHALSPKPAEAGPIGGGQIGSSPTNGGCPWGIPKSLTAVTWTGTDNDDVKCGSEQRDFMDGLGGSDHLYAMGNNDTLKGGTGDDEINAGTGFDQIYPGDGEDWVNGADDDDTIYTVEDGKVDSISGGNGYDVVRITETSAQCGSPKVSDHYASDVELVIVARIGSC
jgi:Ca2+-binding RTX toxin-like protein